MSEEYTKQVQVTDHGYVVTTYRHNELTIEVINKNHPHPFDHVEEYTEPMTRDAWTGEVIDAVVSIAGGDAQ